MRSMLLLHGYDNQVVILRDGMAENVPPRASRLDAATAADGLALISTTVPNANYSAWRRDILWVDERYALVASDEASFITGDTLRVDGGIVVGT